MRPGYNTNGLAAHRLEEALELIREVGYQAVALTLDTGHLDPLRAAPARVAEIATLLERLELEVVIETGGRYLLDPRRKHRPNLLEVDAAERNRRLDLLERCLEIAAALGAGVVSTWTGVLPEGVARDRAQGHLREGLTRLLERARAAGVRIALEPEPGHLVERVSDWRPLHEHFPDLGLCLDIGHLKATGEGAPAQVLSPADIPSLLQVHLEDARAGVHEHLLPGEGEIDFPAVLGDLSALGYSGPVCWELSRHSHMGHQALRRAWACYSSISL